MTTIRQSQDSHLFSSLQVRSIEFKNRIFMSPMCQYSAEHGVPNDWHLVHLGSRAVGGAALVLCEATAIQPEGRISPNDTGLWNLEQVKAFARIVQFINENHAVAGVQLAHAGRKASTAVPWEGGQPLTGSNKWSTIGPSPISFSELHSVPREMTREDIRKVIQDFANSARLALDAGFGVIELHFAHGYLVQEFLSPISNLRVDEYGGSLQNRMRLAFEIAEKVRQVWPSHLPLFARLSCTDWVEGGWELEQTILLASGLRERGVDLIDCSTGGNVAIAQIPFAPGFQVPFAEEVRRRADVLSGAVGLIVSPSQAEEIIKNKKADVVFVGRELLRDPYWPLRAAVELGVEVYCQSNWPKQYRRAIPQK